MHIELAPNTVIDGLTKNSSEILIKIQNVYYDYDKQTISFGYSAYSKEEVEEKGFENSIRKSLQYLSTNILLSEITVFNRINAYKLFVEKIKTELEIQESKISIKAEVGWRHNERHYRVSIDKDKSLIIYHDYIQQVIDDGVPYIMNSYMEYVILYMITIAPEIYNILAADTKNILIENLNA